MRLFSRILHENLDYFANRHSAELNATINTASGSAAGVLNTVIVAGGNLATLLGLTAVMLIQAPMLSLLCCIVMPIVAISARRSRDKVRRIAERQFAQNNAFAEAIQETLQGIKVVKAFSLEEAIKRKLNKEDHEIRAAALEIARASNHSGPAMEALGGVAVAILLLYGGYRVLVVGAKPGEMFSFVTAFLFAYEPLKGLAKLHINLASGLIGVRVLYEMLELDRD